MDRFCLALEWPTVVWHQAASDIVRRFAVRWWKNQSNYFWIFISCP